MAAPSFFRFLFVNPQCNARDNDSGAFSRFLRRCLQILLSLLYAFTSGDAYKPLGFFFSFSVPKLANHFLVLCSYEQHETFFFFNFARPSQRALDVGKHRYALQGIAKFQPANLIWTRHFRAKSKTRRITTLARLIGYLAAPTLSTKTARIG